MSQNFKLIITNPNTLERIGKLSDTFAIARKIEGEVTYDDDNYLAVSVRHDTDSSYHRHEGFGFPILITVRRLKGEARPICQKKQDFAFWRRNSDGRCLVMYAKSNSPENNFEGNLGSTLDWMLLKIRE